MSAALALSPLFVSTIVMVNVSFAAPAAGTAAAEAVQTKFAAATVGAAIVVLSPKLDSDMEHAIKFDPEAVAATVKA